MSYTTEVNYTENGTKINVGVNTFVWDNFCNIFSDLSDCVLEVRREGSKMISMDLNNGTKLWFLYLTPVNWNLGTKPFRMPPRKKENIIPPTSSQDEPVKEVPSNQEEEEEE